MKYRLELIAVTSQSKKRWEEISEQVDSEDLSLAIGERPVMTFYHRDSKGAKKVTVMAKVEKY